MFELLAQLISDSRGFLWAVGALVLLLAIAAPIRTKWLELSVSPIQRGALVVLGVAFFALPILAPPGQSHEAAGRTEPGPEPGGEGVLAAPQIQFSWRPSPLGDAACLDAAETGLRAADLTGVESNGRDVAWGYADRYTGAVWCHPTPGQVLLVVAGPEVEPGQRLLEKLRRTFPG